MIDPNELLTMPCDILVPAAVDRVIHGKNVGQLKCRILAEAANGPTTPEADLILEKRWDEIFVIPDILCNAGGVIVSYFEWVQGLQSYPLDGNRSDRQTFPHPGTFVCAGDQTRKSA